MLPSVTVKQYGICSCLMSVAETKAKKKNCRLNLKLENKNEEYENS